MSINPFRATLAFNGPGVAIDRPYPVDTSVPVKIQAFVDATLIELFINDQFAQSCVIEKWWPMETTISFGKTDGKIEVLKCEIKVHD